MPSDLPLYLGPELPRWVPTTPGDVQRAIDEGDLAERHWVDVKLVQNFTDSAKKELARDFASFANDGGVLLFGVAEDKPTGALSIEPVELDGLRERFDQIARTRLDPPLFITTRPLQSLDDPKQGVMIVEIPASPLAPHQVITDGAYYGRADSTRTRLSDSEIRRLHAQRRARVATAEEMFVDVRRLDAFVDKSLAHLFVVAAPLASPPDLVTERFRNPHELVLPIRQWWADVEGSDRIGVTFESLDFPVPTPAGVALRSHAYESYQSGRLDQDAEYWSLSLEIHDDGKVEFFGGGASRSRPPHEQWLVSERVLVWTESVLRSAAGLAAAAGYSGPWMVIMGLTGIGGIADSRRQESLRLRLWPRTDDPYLDSTEAWTAELLDQPQEVVRRLSRRLLRGLGVDELHQGRWER